MHVLAFGAVAFCGRRSGVPSMLLVAALALHAGISEVVQGSVPALVREGDPLDVVADLVGIALGYLAARCGSSVAGGRSGETMKAWTRS